MLINPGHGGGPRANYLKEMCYIGNTNGFLSIIMHRRGIQENKLITPRVMITDHS